MLNSEFLIVSWNLVFVFTIRSPQGEGLRFGICSLQFTFQHLFIPCTNYFVLFSHLTSHISHLTSNISLLITNTDVKVCYAAVTISTVLKVINYL